MIIGILLGMALGTPIGYVLCALLTVNKIGERKDGKE